jgi:hypothetical protein
LGIITGSWNALATRVARINTSRSFAPAALRDKRALTPTMSPRFASMDAGCGIHVRATQVDGVAVGTNPAASDVDERAAGLRRRAGKGDDLIDAVGLGAASVNPTRDAVSQDPGWSRRILCGMGVNVEESRDDELAARIDGFGGVGNDPRRHCSDAAVRDRHVADAVQPGGRIDDPAAANEEIAVRAVKRLRSRQSGKGRSTDCRQNELAAADASPYRLGR